MQRDQPSDEVMDEASEESFPASDPPAPSSPTEDRGPGDAEAESQDDEQGGGGTTEKRPASDS